MHDAFKVHMLNDAGKLKATAIAESFDGLVTLLALPEGRYKAIVLTKLEEACFFAKKAIASLPENTLAVLLALAFAFAPAAAFAQTAAVEPAAPWWVGLAQAGVGLLGTVLTVVLGFAGSALRAWAKDKAFGTLVDALSLKIEAIVRHAEAELRPTIQAALADGKLDDAEKKAIKSRVMDLVRLHAAEEIKGLEQFGFVGSMLEPILSGLVEKAVASMGASVPGTTSPIEKLA